MGVHQCPKCELKFRWLTELEHHCKSDHPKFKHDYPITEVPGDPQPAHPHATLHPERVAVTRSE